MRRIAFALTLALVVTACTAGTDTQIGGSATTTTPTSTTMSTGEAADESYAGELPAPEFPAGLDWLNTDRPLSLEQLHGKVVVLDFWTYGCINCIHIIPDLERLETEYADELVVIGVHSAKFDTEGNTENIRQTVLRYGIEHPVINDSDFVVWRSYGAQAWPTLFIIDPAGNVVGWHAGEGVYDLFEPVIASLVAEFDAKGQIDRTPLALKLEAAGLPETVLSFPGKVTVDGARERMFIADTNHNRIVQAALDGTVQAVYGSGEQGLTDGPALTARFNAPQGMAVSNDGSTLYVADTNNHAVRTVDLTSGTVATLTGTGAQAPWPPAGGPLPVTPLASPWDLELDGDRLYVAMAGTHQIWLIDLAAATAEPFAGSAIEGTRNGPAALAELAQPSGLALAGDGRLYFADSESSSIRWVDTTSLDVGVSAGSDTDLFTFGDVDGTGTAARLQHPLGVAVVGDMVWFTDTYNSKLKTVDEATLDVRTVAGDTAGWRDGPDPLFFEPGGLDAWDGVIYVADTNNHSIRTYDITTGATATLVLRGIEAFLPPAGTDGYRGTIVELPPVAVAAGSGRVLLDVIIPDGYKVNPDAPSRFDWSVDGPGVVVAPTAGGVVIDPVFPYAVGATFSADATLTTDVSVVYCEEVAQEICLIEQVRIVAPIVVGDGPADLLLTHQITLPDA